MDAIENCDELPRVLINYYCHSERSRREHVAAHIHPANVNEEE